MSIDTQLEKIKRELIRNPITSTAYFFDLGIMGQQMDSLIHLPQQVETFYAMKVNPNPRVVASALTHKNISGIEIASLGEQITAIGENPTPEQLRKIIFTGPGKQPHEIEKAIGIRHLNVESELEAHRANEFAKTKGVEQPILVRLNTKHVIEGAGVTLGSGSNQFGFPQENASEVLEKLSKFKNLQIDGFHMYPATGVLNYENLLKSVEASFQFLKDIEGQANRRFPVLDFGGGFGVDYSGDNVFDIKGYSSGLEELIKGFGFNDRTFYLELGRYLAANMGYFVTKVNDIKTMGDGTKAVICVAGTNAHKRPQVLNVDYPLEVISMDVEDKFQGQENVAREDLFNVYGPFCTSVDKIAWNKSGKIIRVGDYIVQPKAGAYGRTMSPQQFLSHPEIPELFLP